MKNKNVVGGIIPHHLLAGDLIAEFFSNFENDYDTVILIGPNHFSAGNSKIISSSYNWQTPYGILEFDQEVVDELLKFDEIKIEENIFKKEHAINSEVAFIKKTFFKAKFVPLVLRNTVDEKIATKLAQYLTKIAKNKKILVLNSVDFSHYKDSLTAQKNDKTSIKAIENFNKAIDLDSENVTAYNKIGDLYFEQQQYSKAIENYNKATHLDPYDEIAFTNLGNTYLIEKEYLKSIKSFMKCIEIDSNNSKIESFEPMI